LGGKEKVSSRIIWEKGRQKVEKRERKLGNFQNFEKKDTKSIIDRWGKKKRPSASKRSEKGSP